MSGLLSRRLRSGLTALGIAIGIAVMLAVLGIAESSRATLLAELDRIGSNLLTVSAGQTFLGADSALPKDATKMIDRIGPVDSATSVSQTTATVRRTDLIDPAETGGIAVQAADPDLLDALGGTLAAGRFIDDAIDGYPAVVLGSVAAERLGIADLEEPVLVWIADRWWSVVGIMDSLPLAPELDRSALVGRDVGRVSSVPMVRRRRSTSAPPPTCSTTFGRSCRPRPTRSIPRPSTSAGPRTPSRRRAAAASAFTTLFLGLGAVAVLVGALGIANVMLMAVLERRNEIGLRRALGATRGHIVGQFLAEAVLLAGVGGVARRGPRARSSRPPTRSARAGWWRCRWPAWSAGSWRPSWSGLLPASTRPFERPTRHRPTRCEPEAGAQPSRR